MLCLVLFGFLLSIRQEDRGNIEISVLAYFLRIEEKTNAATVGKTEIAHAM